MEWRDITSLKAAASELFAFWIYLTFMGPCIVIIFLYTYPTRCTCYRVYFIWQMLYMFRVVTSPIIRSTNNCIYSIWYLLHRYCYLPLSWKRWNWFECVQTSSNSSTIAADISNGVTSIRCCSYSCLCSWRWVIVTPETCRAVVG